MKVFYLLDNTLKKQKVINLIHLNFKLSKYNKDYNKQYLQYY